MRFRHLFLSSLFSLFPLGLLAQSIRPITHFFPHQGSYDEYSDYFLSGFLQTSPNDGGKSKSRDGFLQMPFIGDPLLVYIGEKDSTQFTAYASGFEMLSQDTLQGNYCCKLSRYGIQANVVSNLSYVEQTFTYPDTTAKKGFLIDIDHSLCGEGNEEMDVVFIDKQNIRAYKRSRSTNTNTPQLYYFAHFSAPFDTWNIRREKVFLKNGEKEARCKVAFTFPLQQGEELTVQSAVSSLNTDDAFSQLPTKLATRHFDDSRRALPSEKPNTLIASTTSPTCSSALNDKKKSTRNYSSQKKSVQKDIQKSNKTLETLFEISTREAQLQTAFFASLTQIGSIQGIGKCSNAAEVLQKIREYYPFSMVQQRMDAATTDLLISRYIQNVFDGSKKAQDFTAYENPQTVAAVWYIFTALGLSPIANSNTYEIKTPLFNVATLYMNNGRRFVIYAQRANKQRRNIASVLFSNTALSAPYSITNEQMAHGGMLEIKLKK